MHTNPASDKVGPYESKRQSESAQYFDDADELAVPSTWVTGTDLAVIIDYVKRHRIADVDRLAQRLEHEANLPAFLRGSVDVPCEVVPPEVAIRWYLAARYQRDIEGIIVSAFDSLEALVPPEALSVILRAADICEEDTALDFARVWSDALQLGNEDIIMWIHRENAESGEFWAANHL